MFRLLALALLTTVSAIFAQTPSQTGTVTG